MDLEAALAPEGVPRLDVAEGQTGQARPGARPQRGVRDQVLLGEAHRDPAQVNEMLTVVSCPLMTLLIDLSQDQS